MYRLGLFALLLMVACQTQTEQLSASELEQVDTLYARRIAILRPDLDSLCDLHQDSLVTLAVDSLLEARQKEMEQILNRQ